MAIFSIINIRQMAAPLPKYKLVLLGESGVGKSSLVYRFVKNEFKEFYEATIGAAYMTQTMTFDEKSIIFEIWDTAGQERYNSLLPMYYRGSHVALIVYDITSTDSFKRAKAWVKELQQQENNAMMLAFVGNKLDLASDAETPRVITTEQGQTFADEKGVPFFETSAKTALNVREMFEQIARLLPEIAPPPAPSAVDLKSSSVTKQESSCC